MFLKLFLIVTCYFGIAFVLLLLRRNCVFVHNNIVYLLPNREADQLGEIFEVQGVTRRGQDLQQNQLGDIDESQFVSASQVFNDPAAWEMLENLGSATSNTVSSHMYYHTPETKSNRKCLRQDYLHNIIKSSLNNIQCER